MAASATHHRPRIRRLALRAVLFALAVWSLFAFEMGLAIYLSGEIDHAQPADVIIVLGADCAATLHFRR
jgi:hypothetical protein